MKKIGGEITLDTGRTVEYEGWVKNFLGLVQFGRLKLHDKTGLDRPCLSCGEGSKHLYGIGSISFLGPVYRDTTYGTYTTEEKRQLYDIIGQLREKNKIPALA